MAHIIKFPKIIHKNPNTSLTFANSDLQEMIKKAKTLVNNKKMTEAISLYEKILELFPNNLDSLFQLGNIYFNIGNIAKAIKIYEKLINISQQPNYFCYINYINALLRVQKYEKAIKNAKKMIKLFPGRIEPYKLLGNICFEMKDFHKAKHYFFKAYEQNKYDPEIIYYFANIYDNLGLIDASIYYWKIFLKINQKKIDIMFKIAKLYMKKNDIKNAKYYFEYVFKKTNDYISAYNLVKIYFELKEYHKIPQISEEILRFTPQDIEISLILAKTYRLINNMKKAKKIIQELLFLNQNNYELFYELALIYKKENKIKKVIYYLEKTIEINNLYLPAYKMLIDIYIKEKNKNKLTKLKTKLLLQKIENPLHYKCLYNIYNFENDKKNAKLLKKYLSKGGKNINE